MARRARRTHGNEPRPSDGRNPGFNGFLAFGLGVIPLGFFPLLLKVGLSEVSPSQDLLNAGLSARVEGQILSELKRWDAVRAEMLLRFDKARRIWLGAGHAEA